MKKEKGNKQTFKLSAIHIMLDINTSDKPVLFTYSMLATPEIPKGNSYKYPYFTNSLKYDESFISNLSLENKMKFFFDKREFSRIVIEMLSSGNNNYVDYKKNLEELNKVKESVGGGVPETIVRAGVGAGAGKKLNLVINTTLDAMDKKTEKMHEIFNRQTQKEMENEQHNIMITLKYLFPIYPKFDEYLKRSDYELTGKIQSNVFKMDTNDVVDSVNYFGWMNRIGALSKEKGASYLKLGKSGPMIVKSVVWENDLVNHPIYSEFIKIYNSRMNDIENNIFDIARKREDSENTFINKIKKYKDELNVVKATKTIKRPDSSNKNEKYELLDFYYDDTNDPPIIKKNIEIPNTPIDQSQSQSQQNTKNEIDIVYGSNMMYDKIYKKWSDNQSVSQQSSSKSSEIKSSAKIIMDEMRIFLKAVLEYRLDSSPRLRQELLNSHVNLVKILDENYAMKSRIGGTLFDFGDGERAMNDLILAAIDLKTIERIEKFVNKKELFNMETITEDDSIKIESEKRIISILNNSYPEYAKLSKSLVDTFKSVLPPDRKTSNPRLYELLSKTKSGNWEKDSPENKEVIEEIYNRFVIKGEIDISIDINPFLYTGVDTVIGKKDNTEDDMKEQTNEIYVRIDVINKSDYESGTNCRVKDNELKNHLQYLLQNKYPYNTMNPNREYIMIDSKNLNKMDEKYSDDDDSDGERGRNKKKKVEKKKNKKGGSRLKTRKYYRRGRNVKNVGARTYKNMV